MNRKSENTKKYSQKTVDNQHSYNIYIYIYINIHSLDKQIGEKLTVTKRR